MRAVAVSVVVVAMVVVFVTAVAYCYCCWGSQICGEKHGGVGVLAHGATA